VVGPHSVSVLDVQSVTGHVIVSDRYKQWPVLKYPGGRRENKSLMINARRQVIEQQKNLKEWLTEQGLSSPVYAIVAFPNKDTNIIGRDDLDVPIFRSGAAAAGFIMSHRKRRIKCREITHGIQHLRKRGSDGI